MGMAVSGSLESLSDRGSIPLASTMAITKYKPFIILGVVFAIIGVWGAFTFTGWALAWFWWAWLSVFVFFVIEFLAIFRKGRGDGILDTLTSHVQAMTKTRWIRDVAAGGLIGFVIWFTFHLWV